MKKILALLLALSTVLAFNSCNKEDADDTIVLTFSEFNLDMYQGSASIYARAANSEDEVILMMDLNFDGNTLTEGTYPCYSRTSWPEPGSVKKFGVVRHILIGDPGEEAEKDMFDVANPNDVKVTIGKAEKGEIDFTMTGKVTKEIHEELEKNDAPDVKKIKFVYKGKYGVSQ